MSEKIKRLTGLSILVAIIVVLTILGSFIKIGAFAISLTLAPIIIGAALYGAQEGALLGGIFGLVVTITCITGWDIGGNVLWTASPFLTALVCITKGTLSGYSAGAVYRFCAKKKAKFGAIMAGIVCPVVNTTIFVLALNFLFHDTLVAWAGGQELMVYVITGLVGMNFVLELASNLLLSNVIVRVVSVRGLRQD